MKFTPFLALTNTIVLVLIGGFILVAVGVAGDQLLTSYFVIPILIVFLTCIITSWFVAFGNPNKLLHSIWRITQTVSILIIVVLLANILYKSL